MRRVRHKDNAGGYACDTLECRKVEERVYSSALCLVCLVGTF